MLIMNDSQENSFKASSFIRNKVARLNTYDLGKEITKIFNIFSKMMICFDEQYQPLPSTQKQILFFLFVKFLQVSMKESG